MQKEFIIENINSLENSQITAVKTKTERTVACEEYKNVN